MIYLNIVLLALIPVEIYIAIKYGEKTAEKNFFDMLFKFGYDNKVAAFEMYNKYNISNGIVFLGDSITQDYNVYEYFANKIVYNRGIGGDTTQGVLKRLEQSVYQLKPSQVVILIGTNDFELLEATAGEIHQRTIEIVKQINKFDSKIEILLLSVLPVNQSIDSKTVGKRNNKDINLLNQLNQSIENTKFINVYDEMLDGDVLDSKYTLEGLHLNQHGYEVVTKIILQYLK